MVQAPTLEKFRFFSDFGSKSGTGPRPYLLSSVIPPNFFKSCLLMLFVISFLIDFLIFVDFLFHFMLDPFPPRQKVVVPAVPVTVRVHILLLLVCY